MLIDTQKSIDQLGWLTPMTIVLKHLLEQSYKANIDWDDKKPHDLVSRRLSHRV